MLAEGLAQRAHESIDSFVDIGIVLTLGNEDVGIAFAIKCLHGDDVIAIVVTVGISDFSRNCFCIGGLLGFDLGDVNVQVIALRAQQRRGKQYTRDEAKSPKGFSPRHRSLLVGAS